MAVRVAINGFGRIGRLVLRAIYESGRKDVEVVAINDLADAKTNAHLLKYDSVHGRFPGTVEVVDGNLVVNGHTIKVVQERDPTKLPWGDLDIDVAMECSGIFTSREGASKHLTAGAKKVLISAPGTDEDITVVYGVNHDKLTAEHKIVSNASCTTNCLAPVAYVLNNAIGIEHGFMTTIHSYTGDQNTVDTMHKDLHRARAAALNIIPTSTGAAKAVGKVLPELKGKLDGTSLRVPTPNVSVVDFKFVAKKATSVEEVSAAIKAAAEGPLKGILGVYAEPLVSTDFNHDPHSSIFALNETKVIDGTFVRIMTWYDNEWGFSNRMSDTAVALHKVG
ncbi:MULTISPECIES: type I glyceraldehyde-3-phosphate dehydrogenase [Nitrospirillum]|uniref:Glyceraldehyde-3-phosphate dehydrogenase n=2 Tax=Nitrospirillum TaxID=1543705 RepID=A0A248JQR3_9PROT|nr:type I glyceraldehyde-3-phosphate dehydrogenase [Nitrospirillum amazonense]ASG21045.1 type I glyceraldehyde-3-phosphate dehydrogenase [Nitrospirillum amazonense CBAmc]TWB12374.1 glyceraldehyde-3-phosphate dehydrogenase (NAD+) [Nitrospirillum amazonense]TWB32457.1 glyceraldehyde-3-phosphate dehydrogenase (NAD+) [Nitrospirillum amazonense]